MDDIARIIRNKENSYKVLNVPEGSTKEQIRSSYKRLAVKIHPDRNPSPKASEAFIILRKAYEDLTDDKPKHRYTENYRNFTRRPEGGNMTQDELEQFIKWCMHMNGGGAQFSSGPFGAHFYPFRNAQFTQTPLQQIEITNKLGIILLIFLFLYSLLR
ncbi:hypothetical protein NEMIN01_1597 [Nematocida minor]|uniref:uncharacterized protein n=1 Tax=Nematocida minor TaxID=1912983 RepID=UPI0022205C1B|nr:uncharacterized protein NEMIN01_1597 [Nematocida minor]KAI5191613.1 hypothetical protein NEMIN01_1597 [Nematocida minor]